MTVSQMEHVLVLTEDIERTRDFYSGVVGLRANQRGATVVDTQTPDVLGFSGVTLRATTARRTAVMRDHCCAVIPAGSESAHWSAPAGLRTATSVGAGMISRGEVGLVIAGYGLGRGAIGQDVFSASVIMVLATTMITPPLLRLAFPVHASTPSG